MFYPHSCFGQRKTDGEEQWRHKTDCVAMEPTDLLVVPYLDDFDPSNPTTPTSPLEESGLFRQRLSYPRARSTSARHSQAGSDTSSAYSGSDKLSQFGRCSGSGSESSGRLGCADLELTRSMCSTAETSSDVEEDGGARGVCIHMLRNVLSKPSSGRTKEEVEGLVQAFKDFQALSGLSHSARETVFRLGRYIDYPESGTAVLLDSQPLTDWYWVLSGRLRLVGVGETVQRQYGIGDTFGAETVAEQHLHHGHLSTASNGVSLLALTQEELIRIHRQDVANQVREEENGRTILVKEKRTDPHSAREGYVIMKATPDRLLSQLLEEPSAVDATFVYDFLLTYRIFLGNAQPVATFLSDTFERRPELRDRVAAVLIDWVSQQFDDFERDPALLQFLDRMEEAMAKEEMSDRVVQLYRACSENARIRKVTLRRSQHSDPLPIELQQPAPGSGGNSRHGDNSGIFIRWVDPGSRAAELGLIRGDQLLEVNGSVCVGAGGPGFPGLPCSTVTEIMNQSLCLALIVRNNLEGFHRQRQQQQKGGSPSSSKLEPITPNNDCTGAQLLSTSISGPGSSSGILKKMRKLKAGSMSENIGGKSGGSTAVSSRAGSKSRSAHSSPTRGSHAVPVCTDTLPSPSSFDDTISVSSGGSGGGGSVAVRSTGINVRSRTGRCTVGSQPDLASTWEDPPPSTPDAVLRVFYRPPTDSCANSSASGSSASTSSPTTSVYLFVNRSTRASEVVMLALLGFKLPQVVSSDFFLCEVSLLWPGDPEKQSVKQSLLKPEATDLADSSKLHSRYYLKPKCGSGQLVDESDIAEMLDETRYSLADLPAVEIAAYLFANTFVLYRDIRPTELIDWVVKGTCSLFAESPLGRFVELNDRYMYWAATAICSEVTSQSRRIKLVKLFIQLAYFCRLLSNVEVFFALMNGLGQACVQRLKATWDKVENRNVKRYRHLSCLLDPSCNMRNLRIFQQEATLPSIPLTALVTKDLTSTHESLDTWTTDENDFSTLRLTTPPGEPRSQDHRLVNFDKMRQMARIVRQFKSGVGGSNSESSLVLESALLSKCRETIRYMENSGRSSAGLGATDSTSNFDWTNQAQGTLSRGSIAVATLTLARRRSNPLNAKKMYEDQLNAKRVRHYMEQVLMTKIERDQTNLSKMSYSCEQQGSTNNMSAMKKATALDLGHRFGNSTICRTIQADDMALDFGSTTRRDKSNGEDGNLTLGRKRSAEEITVRSGGRGVKPSTHKSASSLFTIGNGENLVVEGTHINLAPPAVVNIPRVPSIASNSGGGMYQQRRPNAQGLLPPVPPPKNKTDTDDGEPGTRV